MLKNKHLLSFLLILLTAVAFGQPKSFSQKPEVFIKEINKYIATENTKEGVEVMKQFTMKWDSAEFVDVEQRNIINVTNRMLNNDMRIPSFLLFTETMLYAKDSIEEAKYISWSKALMPAISNGNKTFLTLLTASRNLFKDNVLYSSETKTWSSSRDNYRFIFDDNRVQISFRDVDLICQAHVDKLVVYQTSGSYERTFIATSGCDSLVTTQLTMLPAETVSEAITICRGGDFQMPDGSIMADVQEAFQFTQMLTAGSGCDSLLITTVTPDGS